MDSVRNSLKEECLFQILQNFERYYAAFKVCQGTILEKHFEFLGRVYSETLFRDLLFCDKLKAEYFAFLINPYIKHLNLLGIEEQLIPALLDQLSDIESNIVSLKVAFWDVQSDHYKQLISSVPHVEVIEVSNIIYPEVLEEIGKRCPFLRVLKIVNCDIGDGGLRNIFLNVNGQHYENKACLEHLEIQATMVGNDGISFVLSHAPSLKHLEYNNITEVLYEKHKSDLENNCVEASRKYSLTSLRFPAWIKNVSDTLKICTTLCPDVSYLNINCLENDEQLLLCSKFLHLKDLKIYVETNPFSYESISQFLKLRGKGLFSFQMENGCISAEALVEHCPKLHSVKLSGVCFKPLDQKQLLFSKTKLCNLKTLAITNSDFSVKETADSVKLILSNAKNVNSVDFSTDRGLSDNFFRTLSQLGLIQVHELNLNLSDVTVSPVAELLSHGNLRSLNVASCSNIKETDYFQLLACVGDNDFAITFRNDSENSYDSASDYDNEYNYEDDIDYDDYYDLDACDYDDFEGYDYDQYDLYEDWHSADVLPD